VLWNELRLVIAHNPVQAQEQTNCAVRTNYRVAGQSATMGRQTRWAGCRRTGRGRKLSDSGAKARLYHEVSEAHLARIIKVDLKTELFSYTIDEAAQSQAEMMDGKLLLVTNVPDLKPAEVVPATRRWPISSAAFGYSSQKSRLRRCTTACLQRIRAHAMLCFMALIVYRVMRQRLKLAKSDLSPERALAQLRRIQRHSVRINTKKPLQDTQMSLL
jgi:hypothetical protein